MRIHQSDSTIVRIAASGWYEEGPAIHCKRLDAAIGADNAGPWVVVGCLNLIGWRDGHAHGFEDTQDFDGSHNTTTTRRGHTPRNPSSTAVIPMAERDCGLGWQVTASYETEAPKWPFVHLRRRCMTWSWRAARRTRAIVINCEMAMRASDAIRHRV